MKAVEQMDGGELPRGRAVVTENCREGELSRGRVI